MYDEEMLFEAYADNRECRDNNREDVTSREGVIDGFTWWANHIIGYGGIPASEKELKIFIELVQLEMYSANYDYSVITDEEWEAIARDIIAKAK